MKSNPVWHYWPDPDEHLSACGRADNTWRPFNLSPDEQDVTCQRCQATQVYRQRVEAAS